jgi:predicted DNA-binding transcriptional regulator YafY
MPRNAEVVRQWTILREIERGRMAGATIDELAARCHVTTRTIRRDLQALEEAGFPLYDHRGDDGRARWRLNGEAFRSVGAGLTLSELCALYFSRALVESQPGMPFHDEIASAFDKVTRSLTPHMRQFLDQLPGVFAAKGLPVRQSTAAHERTVLARAQEAVMQQRQAVLTYHSRSSQRTKPYTVHPYRLAFAQGSLYLEAFVPEYREVRTFAVERIERLSLLEDRFTRTEALPDEAFPHSLGVHSGPPEEVAIAFQPDVADYVRGRQWHRSQQVAERADGTIVVTLNVCLDHALRSWVLSFGASARVLFPEPFARDLARTLEAAAEGYRTTPGPAPLTPQ